VERELLKLVIPFRSAPKCVDEPEAKDPIRRQYRSEEFPLSEALLSND
jgi:hypothetical protein